MRGHALLGTGTLLLAVSLAGCSGDSSPDAGGPHGSGGTAGSPAAGAAETPAGAGQGATTGTWDAARAGRDVEALVEADGSSWSSLRTVLVSKDGRLVLAKHWGRRPDRPRDISAMTTTVVGT